MRQAKLQLTVVLFVILLYSIPRFAEHRLVWSPILPKNNTIAPTVTESPFVNTDGYFLDDDGIDFRSTTEGREGGEDSIEWKLERNFTSLGESKTFRFVYYCFLDNVLIVVLPLIILVALDIRLVRELRTMRRARAEMTGASSASTQDSNITLALVIVIVVFIVCQVPALITTIIECLLQFSFFVCWHCKLFFSPFSLLLTITNSAVNFAIYTLFCRKFRAMFCQMICTAYL
jgi:7 transmembrane receptor (rhodopsin family)